MWDSWLVDSGATHHFYGYREVLYNLVEMETKIKIILGDKSTHHMEGFGSVKFHLNSGKSVMLYDVMYVPGLVKNLVFLSYLEDKGTRVAFIKGNFLTWLADSPMKDAFTLGLRFEGLYRITGRPLLIMENSIDNF